MATSSFPDLAELIPHIVETAKGSFMDHQAKKAGYDPSSSAILSALTTDYNDATNPQNTSAPSTGLAGNYSIGQVKARADNKRMLEALIDHYGKRFGKPQKKGDGTDEPEPGRLTPVKLTPEQFRNMT